MSLIDTVSGNDSQNVQDSVPWILNDFDMSLGKEVVVNESICCFSSEYFYSSLQVYKKEMIFYQFAHLECTAVDNCE